MLYNSAHSLKLDDGSVFEVETGRVKKEMIFTLYRPNHEPVSMVLGEMEAKILGIMFTRTFADC